MTTVKERRISFTLHEAAVRPVAASSVTPISAGTYQAFHRLWFICIG